VHDAGNSGAQGIMFNLMALRDTVIKSFDVYTDGERTGGYVGHEMDASGWEIVFNKSVQQMGRTDTTTLSGLNNGTGVIIRAGTIQSFYIFSANDNYVMYDMGSVDGAAFGSDASLTIYEGAGVASDKFPGAGVTDVVISPRVFKGKIHYDAVTFATPAPSSVSPTVAPSKLPTTSVFCPDLKSEEACVANAACSWRTVMGVCGTNRGNSKGSKRAV
jgi:hypothetical protein